MPKGPNQIDAERAEAQREAAAVPLPQSDDADLIVQDHWRVFALWGKAPGSIPAEPSGFHETQMVEGDAMSSAVPWTQELGYHSEVSAGHAPKAAELNSEMELDVPSGMIHPFQDESLTLAERVSAFNRFDWEVRTPWKEWAKIKGEKPKCTECERKHPPPCMTRAQHAALRAVLKEGKRLRDEFNSAKLGPPRLPHAEMLATEVVMAGSKNGVTQWKPKSTLCRLCAKWHPGGAKECQTPFCTKGCGLNHLPREACREAVKRFENLKLVQGKDGEGEWEEREKPTPAPSRARATGAIDLAKFGTFLNSLPDDPDVMKAAGELFSTMNRKRSTEKSAENADSDKKKEEKKTTGGGSSCRNMKPMPKGPNGPGGKGGKGTRGLSGSVYSMHS
jgi:hypothetical protein